MDTSRPTDSEPREDEFLDGVDAAFAVSGSVATGSTLRTTADLNLRSGASTGYRVVLTMPRGSTVTVASTVLISRIRFIFDVSIRTLSGFVAK